MENWTRLWVGLCSVILGNIAWIFSFGQTPLLVGSLLLTSIVLNVLGIALFAKLILRTLSKNPRLEPRNELREVPSPATPRVAIAAREELDRLWRRGPGISVVTLLAAGPVIAALAGWWIDIALYSHVVRTPLSIGVGVALLFLGLASFALVTGIWSLVHRPTEIKVNDVGFRIQYARSAALELSWDARPLTLSLVDGRTARPLVEGTPTCLLSVGRYLSFAVPTGVLDAILQQLSSHDVHFDVRTMGSGDRARKIIKVDTTRYEGRL